MSRIIKNDEYKSFVKNWDLCAKKIIKKEMAARLLTVKDLLSLLVKAGYQFADDPSPENQIRIIKMRLNNVTKVTVPFLMECLMVMGIKQLDLTHYIDFEQLSPKIKNP